MAKQHIPNYRRQYEEDQASGELESLHIEPLEMRSRQHNWNIKPHRHDEIFQLFSLSSGQADATIDGELHCIKAPQIFTIPPLCVHGFELQENSTGFALSALGYEVSDAVGQIPKLALLYQSPLVSKVQKDCGSSEHLHSLLSAFYREFNGNETGRRNYLRALLRLILIQFARENELAKGPSGQTPSQDEEKFQRLVSLINSHYKQHQSNEFYASQINITPSKLTQLTNSMIGQSPHEMLTNKLLQESKRLLTYTALPVGKVTDELGMKDPAYFCRFFKKKTGFTPGQYRAQARKL